MPLPTEPVPLQEYIYTQSIFLQYLLTIGEIDDAKRVVEEFIRTAVPEIAKRDAEVEG